MLTDNKSGYGWISSAVHWLSAIAVFGLFGLGLYMVDLSYYDPFYRDGLFIHKSIGALLALLTVFRVIWKIFNKKVELLESHANWEKRAASFTHKLLYIGLLTLFLSGYLISTSDGRAISVFDWFNIPGAGALFDNQSDISGEVHFYVAWGLIILVVIHAAGALKHHFLDKDNTLKRMLFRNHKNLED
ncbi:cytochrome b [Pseudoalteromonas sp. T1lg65]|uniref:cytochrome b n=1 Tax=Pseudoalteromonas sp. T1lg65 TaxID=2077101 RepID=UPI003F7ACCBA